MDPSPELRALTLQTYEAYTRPDLAFVDRHTSRQAEGAFLGTGPAGPWADVDALKEVAQQQAAAGLAIVPGAIQAYQEGSVGWVLDTGAAFRDRDGTETPFRFSAVWHREDGAWRMVQCHASVGVPGADGDAETNR